MDKAAELALHKLGNDITQKEKENLVCWDNTTTANVTYIQYCEPGRGGDINAAISKIKYVNSSTGVIGYPNGDPGFKFVWADRAIAYTYSPY